MPITYETGKDRNPTVFKVTGTINFNEAMSALKSFYDGKPTKNVILDLHEISELPFFSQEIETIANYPPRYTDMRSGGKTAIVSQNDMIFGLARMLQIQSKLNFI